jgi:hypothetical protein
MWGYSKNNLNKILNKNDFGNQKGYLERIWRIQKVGNYYISIEKKNDLDEHQEVLELYTKVSFQAKYP